MSNTTNVAKVHLNLTLSHQNQQIKQIQKTAELHSQLFLVARKNI